LAFNFLLVIKILYWFIFQEEEAASHEKGEKEEKPRMWISGILDLLRDQEENM
jgi:hypothetical protein